MIVTPTNNVRDQLQPLLLTGLLTALVFWAMSALVFWVLIRIRLFVWLAVLPDGIARIALMLAGSNLVMAVFGVGIIALSGVALWFWIPGKLAAGIAILVPIVLLGVGLGFGRMDKMNREHHIVAVARQGDVQTTREYLLVKWTDSHDLLEVRTLLRAGTDPNAQFQGRSPIHGAVGTPDILNLLLQAGVTPDKDAFISAVSRGKSDSLKLLFDATPDDGKALVAAFGDQAITEATNIPIKETASIHKTNRSERDEIVRLLIERGAPPIPCGFNDYPWDPESEYAKCMDELGREP